MSQVGIHYITLCMITSVNDQLANIIQIDLDVHFYVIVGQSYLALLHLQDCRFYQLIIAYERIIWQCIMMDSKCCTRFIML